MHIKIGLQMGSYPPAAHWQVQFCILCQPNGAMWER